MIEQPRRPATEDQWNEEEKEEVETLIRRQGPVRPRIVINQHQRDEGGSREQEEDHGKEERPAASVPKQPQRLRRHSTRVEPNRGPPEEWRAR